MFCCFESVISNIFLAQLSLYFSHISAKQTQIRGIIRTVFALKIYIFSHFASWQLQQMNFCQPNNAREKSTAAAGKYVALD